MRSKRSVSTYGSFCFLLICIIFGSIVLSLSLPQKRWQEPFEVSSSTQKPYYVSVLAIFKNEAKSLNLWIRHYIWMGVDHFFLIDNGSTDNSVDVIRRSWDESVVSVFSRPEKHKQVEHCKDIYSTADIPNQTTWLIMADLDEYWYSPGGATLAENLHSAQEEDIAIIYGNWRMFGSDGLQNQPPDIRTSIVHRQPDLHSNTKTIFQTANVDKEGIEIHFVNTALSESHIKRNDDRFRLNHYPIQSLEYFKEVKMKRGDVRTSDVDNIRDMNYFRSYDKNQTHLDEDLKHLVEAGDFAEQPKGVK